MGYTKTDGSLTQDGTLSADDFIWNNPANAFPDPWAFLPPVLTASSADLAIGGLSAAAPVLSGTGATVAAPGLIASSAALGDTATGTSSLLGAPSDTTSTQTTLDPLGAPVLNTGSAGGARLAINVTYNSSSTISSDFTNAVNTAVQFLESKFSNAITLNFQFGFGVYGSLSAAVPSGHVGINTQNSSFKSYSTVHAALIAHSSSTDDQAALATLPAGSTDPTHSTSNALYVPYAQQKVLNIQTVDPATIDGWIGISNTAFTDGYDVVGVLEHEITEAMGRVGKLDGSFHSILDLFRYSAPGTRSLSPTNSGSFSIDGGNTLLAPFDTTSGEDPGDWLPSVGNDSFAAHTLPGNQLTISATDLREMDVLGYDLACFAAGTRIAAERGEVPVEDLRIGERVYTSFGGLAPIRWIAQRKIDSARHPDPLSVQPIRVATEAFAAGIPVRPLFLSPEHAVQVDDALIPIRLLLNGGSVAQHQDAMHVHYWHIELDHHDLLFAEGLAAESYLDTGNRGMFANAPGPVQLHPDMAGAQAQRETESCLPLLLDPDRLEPVWRALAQRSQQLGFAVPEPPETTSDPGLHLMVDGKRIDPAARAGDRCWFALPGLSRGARLVSRSVVPSALRPWLDDRRRLGIMLHGITLHTVDGPVPLPLDDPRLTDGWWAPEGDYPTLWRWTNGNAALPPTPDCRLLELRLGASLAYPLAAPVPAQRSRHVA